MEREEAIKWQEAFKKTYGNFPPEATEACDMAIKALKEQERIIKLLEELRDDPIMYCSEDYWEGHYMAAKEAIAIVRGDAE